MRKSFIIVLAAFFVLGLAARAQAGEIDILVQKLVEKGILTPGEAQTIVTETKEEVKKEIATGKSESLPKWLQMTKLKGDFRFRYQFDRATNTENENKARIRARLGVESQVNDKMKVGIGMATGRTGDPRSTNVTLGQNGSGSGSAETNQPASFKNIILDYAYGQWDIAKGVTLIGGKFANPIWRPTDFLWDSDLNPEGAALNLSHKLSSDVDLFMNNMIFVLDHYTGDAEEATPLMAGIQPGLKYRVSDKIGLKGALAAYIFSNVQKKNEFTGQSTNTSPSDIYKYNYNAVNPNMEISIKEPLGGIVPYAAIFGEGVYNVSKDVDSSKGGFSAGLKFGAEKVEAAGDWQAKMIYAKLGRDSWLDIFPDSDRYSGKTYMKSYEAALAYGLTKNSYLEADYYFSQSLGKSSTGYSPSHVFQLDWNLKF